MTENKEIIVLTGKSGVGKTSLLDYLVENGEQRVVKLTTREPRADEVAGANYNFISFDEFINDPTMIVKTRVGHNLYGVNQEALDNQGRLFLSLDVKGILDLEKSVNPESIRVMMVEAPSQLVIKRMLNRGDGLDNVRVSRRFDEMTYDSSSIRRIKSPVFHLDGRLDIPDLAEEMFKKLNQYNSNKQAEKLRLLADNGLKR